jgi:hypothetical protein
LFGRRMTQGMALGVGGGFFVIGHGHGQT